MNDDKNPVLPEKEEVPKPKGFISWVEDHVTPEVGFVPDDDEPDTNGISDWWKSVKDRIKIGIGFRFRF